MTKNVVHSLDFLVIGERRSGTTSVARWMESHPDIFLHPKMDIGYFIDKELVGSREWSDGKANYNKWEKEHSKEEYLSYFKEANRQMAIGEKSADYFFWHQCHRRIKDYFPDIKLIITLRNPVERAWSMYWNEKGKGRESLNFEEAIKQEPERIARSDYAKDHLSYMTRGFYDESLSRLYQTFEKKQVYVLILEKARLDPQKYLEEIYSFLGVDNSIGFDNTSEQFNLNWALIPKSIFDKYLFLKILENTYFKFVSLFAFVIFRNNIYKRRKLLMLLAKPFRYSKTDRKMKTETEDYLHKMYSPHITNLELLLEMDLSIWL